MPAPIITKALFLGDQPVLLVDSQGNPLDSRNYTPAGTVDEQSLLVNRQILLELRAIRIGIEILIDETRRPRVDDASLLDQARALSAEGDFTDQPDGGLPGPELGNI